MISEENLISFPIPTNRQQRRSFKKFQKKLGVLTLEQFFQLVRCPKQRDEVMRSQQPKVRKKFKKLLAEHCDVIAAIATEDITHEKTEKVYKKGTVFLIDGHTRRVIWVNEYKEGQGNWCDHLPEEINVTYYYISSYKELCDLYDHFDNSSSTEKTADKYYGACKVNEFELTNPKLKQVMAIQYAAHKLYPTVFTSPKAMSTYDLEEVAFRFKDALLALDKVGGGTFKKGKNKKSYTMATTPIICALLMAFKKHGVRLDENGTCSHPLFEIAQKLNKGHLNNTADDGRMDGVSHIVNEWTYDLLIQEKPFNFNTIDKELSFCLYWIEAHLTGKRLEKIGSPDKKTWTTYVSRYTGTTFDALNTALNVTEC